MDLFGVYRSRESDVAAENSIVDLNVVSHWLILVDNLKTKIVVVRIRLTSLV